MNNPFVAREWRLAHGRALTLGPRSVIMGVLNVTPDSFSDGGDFIDPDTALRRAKKMIGQGAEIIDVGGESTRPGAGQVDSKTEQSRVLPVIDHLVTHSSAIISVDTYRAETAQAAVEAGAHIVNDIWGCQRDPAIAEVAANSGAGLVVMSNRRDRTVLPDLLEDAVNFLAQSLNIAAAAGVPFEQMVIDPGFGFAPTTAHDIPILAELEKLHELQHPVLVGTSRKRFLGDLTGKSAQERAVATAATSVIARMKGAAIFRVHDIVENRDALAVADAVVSNGSRT